MLVLISSTARCSSRRPILRAHTCSARRLMISMPVRSPLCTVRSKVWPANAFWWMVPSGLRSKKQPSSFSSSRIRSTRQRHQLPGELLVGEPGAADDGVHEMALDRVLARQRDVVAALHHARATALAEQALHRDGDRELGRRLVRVQRGEQARAARAEDQDVGVELAHARVPHASPGTASPARRQPDRIRRRRTGSSGRPASGRRRSASSAR